MKQIKEKRKEKLKRKPRGKKKKVSVVKVKASLEKVVNLLEKKWMKVMMKKPLRMKTK